MIDHDPTLLLELLEDERVGNRRRETFLLSVIVHLLLVLLVVTRPDLFNKFVGKSVPVRVPPKQLTMLYAPPALPKLKAPPKTQILSDANRRAQPVIQTPPPRVNFQPPAPPPPTPSNSPKPGNEPKLARQIPPIGLPEFPDTPKEAPKPRPMLQEVPPPHEPTPSPSQAQLTLSQALPAGQGTDAILRGMAKEHSTGGGQGFGIGGGTPEFDSQNPNLNMPGPQILSDTMGVDFNPYLLRVLSLVRRNWYSVIPEIARLGKQGRVVLEFSILRNGNVQELVLRSGSTMESLNGAALASIRLSNPFPPLPAEFPGQDIRLRFTYLYNMRVD